MQNIVYLGYDNPIVIEFAFTGDFSDGGLSNFTDIRVIIGDETYTLLLNPTNIVIESNSELRVLIGDTTSLGVGAHYITIIGFSGVYDDGYVLGGCDSLDRVVIKQI